MIPDIPDHIPFLSLTPQHRLVEEDLTAAIQRVLSSSSFILGDELKKFERAFASYSGTKFSCGVANGLDAITLALRALDIGSGDEVIVPSNTYIATWLAVTNVGAKPVPVEPDVVSLNIDVNKIGAALSKKTRAIIPVHLYGHACDMSAIMQLANENKLWIIEDNAQAHGAEWQGRKTGSFGHCNATSFYPGKNLGALGDGGAITTDIQDLYKKVTMLRNYGSEKKYHHELLGVNSRLDELQAAFLSVKLVHLNEWTKQRQQIADFYMKGLHDVGDLILPQKTNGSSHVFHLFVIRTNQRDELQEYLANHGIQTLIHYPVPPHLQKAYTYLGLKKGDLPICEELAKTSLSLPLWPGMEESSIAIITSSILKFYAGR